MTVMAKTIPCVSCGAPVEIPAAWDEAKNTVADTFAKFWGGSCVADSQCADPVAHCSSTESK